MKPNDGSSLLGTDSKCYPVVSLVASKFQTASLIAFILA